MPVYSYPTSNLSGLSIAKDAHCWSVNRALSVEICGALTSQRGQRVELSGREGSPFPLLLWSCAELCSGPVSIERESTEVSRSRGPGYQEGSGHSGLEQLPVARTFFLRSVTALTGQKLSDDP